MKRSRQTSLANFLVKKSKSGHSEVTNTSEKLPDNGVSEENSEVIDVDSVNQNKIPENSSNRDLVLVEQSQKQDKERNYQLQWFANG